MCACAIALDPIASSMYLVLRPQLSRKQWKMASVCTVIGRSRRGEPRVWHEGCLQAKRMYFNTRARYCIRFVDLPLPYNYIYFFRDP